MGCRSDYQEPTGHEIERAKVLALLEEIKTGKLPSWFDNAGSSPAYNSSNQKNLDDDTEKLCSILKKKKSVKKYSLELQLWWKKHQEFDAERLKKEKQEKALNNLKNKALSKLSPAEIKALGIK